MFRETPRLLSRAGQQKDSDGKWETISDNAMAGLGQGQEGLTEVTGALAGVAQ